ncbi:MAG: DMT family transporter [Bacteroidota bacterium]|jgi:drug/metabolite transporter (DMT)-like permease
MKWILYIILCLIWGSSFILMKEGLISLTPFEVAAIRMLSAGLVLIPFAYRSFREITKKQRHYSILTGILGSYLPAIFFCIAQTKIDSALAGMLNALTPLFVLLIGAAFFKLPLIKGKLIGILIGFAGMIILFLKQTGSFQFEEMPFLLIVVLATICYGVNVNIANRHLQGVRPLAIASVAFTFLIPLSLLLLYTEGFFSHVLTDNKFLLSIASASFLGITGTALATVLFYMLMKRAGPLFSSMVTYGIPFVAVGWGFIYGEEITVLQIIGLFIILTGVYVVNSVKAGAEN